MTYRVRISKAAQEDLERLLDFLAPKDPQAAVRASAAIAKGYAQLQDMPFASHKADPTNPFLRELIISFGGAGYVALFEIDNDTTVTVLAVRHQRENDYY